jgi:hypothetical protein
MARAACTFGLWNSIWKRFWRLSRSGVMEAFFQVLAETSKTAHLVQMLDSTVVRAHASQAKILPQAALCRALSHRAGYWQAKTVQRIAAFVAFAGGRILVKSVHKA